LGLMVLILSMKWLVTSWAVVDPDLICSTSLEAVYCTMIIVSWWRRG